MAGSHEILGPISGNRHALDIVFGLIAHRDEPPGPSVRLISERARERREAYERRDCGTYVGNVYLRPEQGSGPHQQDWSFQEAAPVPSPNPDPNIGYGNHTLHNGDYLTIFDPKNRNLVVWEGRIDLYTKGIRDPQGNPWDYTHQRGVDEGDFFRWFNGLYPAELRAPVKSGKLATIGETVMPGNRPQPLPAAA